LSFCIAQNRVSLPATLSTVLLYIAHLHLSATVSASSMANYVSAINTLHKSLGFPAPGPHPLITQAIKGAGRQQTVVHIADPRLPLPADDVVRILAFALHRPVHILLPCAAVVFGYLTGARGASVLRVEAGDVIMRPDSIVFVIRREKSAAVRYTARRVVLDCSACPKVHQFFTRVLLLGPQSGHSPELLLSFSALFASVLDIARVRAPPGGRLLGHSCRIGKACALRSLGVPDDIICAQVGWVLGSSSLYKYVKFAVQPSEASFALFGSLLDPAKKMAFQSIYDVCTELQ